MDKKIKVLCIDDEKMVLRIMGDYLEDLGLEVELASSGAEGLEKFSEFMPDIVFVDMNMPGINGLSVLNKITNESPETPVIIVSGTGDIRDVIGALRNGAWDYLTKPIEDMTIIDLSLKKALERSRLIRENREHKENLESLVQERTAEIKKANLHLESMLDDIVKSFAIITEKRDPYTAGHQLRVAALAESIAGVLGNSSKSIESVRIAGTLHDVGKIYVPQQFLAKPSTLTKFEFEIVKTHSAIGYDILKTINFDLPIAQIVRQHHERVDGSGYPDGIKGGEMLVESKIIAVADAVEAISSHRPYRASLGLEKALSEIKACSGTHFCPECVDACIDFFTNNYDQAMEVMQQQSSPVPPLSKIME